MANELTLSTSMSFAKGTIPAHTLSEAGKFVSVTGSKFFHNVQAVGTSEEALLLGDVTAGGHIMLINRDSTNFVNVKVATAGAIFAKLKPLESMRLRLGSGATAPFVIADTASCNVEVFAVED